MALFYQQYNKHSFKAIALDLDGTLLNNNKKVSDNTKHILQQIHKHYKIDIALVSGRAPRLIEPVAEALGINCYIIGYNGAQGWSKKDANGVRHELFTDPLPNESLKSIFKWVSDRNLPLNIYLDFVYAIDKPDIRPFTEHYSKLTGATYKYVHSYEELQITHPAKCIILNEVDALCDRLMIEAARDFPELAIIKSNCHSYEHSQWYVEFLRKGVDKGTALQKLCDAVGASVSEVIAFGDAENDINMLQVAKIGVCMAQGVECVKSIAHIVAEFNNDEDGVVRELQKLFELDVVF